jgi:hypothetical protein
MAVLGPANGLPKRLSMSEFLGSRWACKSSKHSFGYLECPWEVKKAAIPWLCHEVGFPHVPIPLKTLFIGRLLLPLPDIYSGA